MKKVILLVIGIPVGLVILVLTLSLLSIKVFRIRPYPLLTPKYTPNGYIRQTAVNIEKNDIGYLIILNYLNANENKLAYSIQFGKSKSLNCNAMANANFVSNLDNFAPKKSLEGCKMTLTAVDGSQHRSYIWTAEDSKYSIIINDTELTDEDILKIANSLGFEVVFVKV